jgi:hypothetical protein
MNLRLTALLFLISLIVPCQKNVCQEQDTLWIQADSLRYILTALSKGIEYKNNNYILTNIINYKDSIIVKLSDRNELLFQQLQMKPTEIIKHNWFITFLVSSVVLITSTAIYISILK